MAMKRTLLFVSAAVAALPLGGAQAQEFGADRNHNESVTQRPRPEYDALGVRMGSISLFPQLWMRAGYDDNIFATPNNHASDEVYTVRPVVDLATNWSRHALHAEAYFDQGFYQDNKKEGHGDADISGEFRLDVLRDAFLGVGGEYGELHEDRTVASSTPVQLRPTQYSLANAYLYGTYTFNRVRTTLRVEDTHLNYEDDINRITGANIDEDYRDGDNGLLQGRVEVALSPDTALVFQATGNRREYDNPPPAGTPNRNSRGWEVLGGFNTDLSHLIRGELTVGYLSQDYEAASLKTVSGLAVKSQLEWFVTPLTTVTVNASREVNDSGIITLPSFIATTGLVKIDHELLRNVIIGASARYSNDDYQGGDRTDDYLDAGVSARYLVNRHATLLAEYNYGTLNSSGALNGSDYVINRFVISLLLKM
jgi:hypothetical protein